MVSDAAQSSVGGHREQPRRGVGRGSHAGQQEGQPSIRAIAAPTSRRRPAPMRRNHKKRGVAPSRFGPASRSCDGEGDSAYFQTIATMARSLGASMARGLGILLIMMTLSEIAATRAAPRPAIKGAAPSPWRRHRAPPAAHDSRRCHTWPQRPPEGQRTRHAPQPTLTSHETRRLGIQRRRLDLLHRRGGHLCVLRGLWDRC